MKGDGLEKNKWKGAPCYFGLGL